MKRLEMFARRLLAFQFYAASGIGMSKVLLSSYNAKAYSREMGWVMKTC
jgi:hypothetical protein